MKTKQIIKGLVVKFPSKDGIDQFVRLTGLNMGRHTSLFASDCIATMHDNKEFAKNKYEFYKSKGAELIKVELHLPFIVYGYEGTGIILDKSDDNDIIEMCQKDEINDKDGYKELFRHLVGYKSKDEKDG